MITITLENYIVKPIPTEYIHVHRSVQILKCNLSAVGFSLSNIS